MNFNVLTHHFNVLTHHFNVLTHFNVLAHHFINRLKRKLPSEKKRKKRLKLVNESFRYFFKACLSRGKILACYLRG